ncbi:MAG: hypothetical protein JWN70_2696 [Planctomycetaceae bacterium]|nr:hypothetical protein [Planctomycetaceae bacterium]
MTQAPRLTMPPARPLTPSPSPRRTRARGVIVAALLYLGIHQVRVLSLACGFVLIACLVGAEPTPGTGTLPEDVARESLAKRNFPWFDAEKQAFRPLVPPTDDRHNVQADRLSRDRGDDHPMSDSATGLSLIARVCLYGVMAAVVCWLGYLFYLSLDFSASKVDEVKPAEAKLDPAKLEALPAGVRNVTDFLAESRRLAQESDFNAAMVFYFSWQLVTLNQEGVLELEVSKINRQYLYETSRNRPELSQLFYRSARLFEDAFYGSVRITREAFLEVWESREEFRSRTRPAGRRR